MILLLHQNNSWKQQGYFSSVLILSLSRILSVRLQICTVIHIVHSVEKPEILSHQKIFRQINSLVTYFVKPLLSRNFCQKCVRENFRNFHTVQCGNTEIYSHIFRENSWLYYIFCIKLRKFPLISRFFGQTFVKETILLNKLLKSWFDEIFFDEREFLVFPHY